MGEAKLKKWQKALNHLDLWGSKVAATKQSILEKYGDINELYNRSLDLAFLEYKGSLDDELKLEARKVDLLFWEIINRAAADIARKVKTPQPV